MAKLFSLESLGPRETEQIEEAFLFEQTTGNTRDLQKTLLAVSFLLDEESNAGNDPVSPEVALGLGEILRGCARKLRYSYQSKHPDVRVENGETVAVDGQNMISSKPVK